LINFLKLEPTLVVLFFGKLGLRNFGCLFGELEYLLV
jgi:hypothetical protein